MKFDFYKSKIDFENDEIYIEKDYIYETLEDIKSFGRMDEHYVLTDYDGNQFIRNFKNYTKIDMWIEDSPEYDIDYYGEFDYKSPGLQALDEENGVIDLFNYKGRG